MSEVGKYIVHCGDSMEIMKGMNAGSVSCTITDPPYAGFGFSAGAEGYIEGLLPFVWEMMRCTEGDMARKRISISQPRRKMNLLAEKLAPSNFLRIKDAFADQRGEDALFMLMNPIDLSDRSPENWTSLPGSQHPNHRNVNKMAPLIKVMSKPGDIVLDPFCGSAAIGLAAVLLGRHFVGVELDKDRAEEAENRLKAIGSTRLEI